MYLVTVHAAFGISTRVKYAVSGRRVEGNMRPLRVVKADPVVDDPFGLKAVGDLVQIHSLLLQGPPEPLDEDIVQIPSSAFVRVVIQSAPVYWLP